ncbi:MAG TPA: metallophosphoesterase [Polyangiales bacterium]|nr:metallophosphoesterase [Polyangiales bacterium]
MGDLHGHWDDWDARYFSASDYDLVLVTGDLGSGTSDNGVRIARSLGRMARRALVMPGNNDVQRVAQIAAELGHQRGLLSLLQREAGQVHLCGYSLHAYAGLTVLAARPYSRGGPELYAAEALQDRFGVSSMEDSARKLCALIDQVETPELIVLAHNGPTGLGARATDIWGRDFAPEEGDWGDPDLRVALDYARRRDRRVLAVFAGHMHTHTHAGPRAWCVEREGTLFINAARVPRIWEQSDGQYRYHVALDIAEGVTAREVLVREE